MDMFDVTREEYEQDFKGIRNALVVPGDSQKSRQPHHNATCFLLLTC